MISLRSNKNINKVVTNVVHLLVFSLRRCPFKQLTERHVKISMQTGFEGSLTWSIKLTTPHFSPRSIPFLFPPPDATRVPFFGTIPLINRNRAACAYFRRKTAPVEGGAKIKVEQGFIYAFGKRRVCSAQGPVFGDKATSAFEKRRRGTRTTPFPGG